MPRRLMWVATCCAALLGGRATGLAQSDADPPQSPSPEAQHLLEIPREGLLAPDLPLTDRRRWAAVLLSLQTPESTALVVELLGRADRPEVQQALCDALSDRGLPPDKRLNPAFIEPLIALLGTDVPEIRALAAQTLADFPGDGVPERLGALAARSTAKLVQRVAAVDALSPNTHRRAVVEQLIKLLDADTPEIVDRIVKALGPLVPRSFGTDASLWREWWSQKSTLSNEAWLVEQLQFQRDRRRRVEDELDRVRAEARSRDQASAARLSTLQRELYRVLGEEQREIRLTEWLSDSIPHIKATAMSIIKERMGDEGKRPTGGVLTRLLAVLADESPVLRREALQIVQNVRDPAVDQAILAQLGREQDTETRCAFFEALGALGSPGAVEALAREIGAQDQPTACVRQAALALGRIATTGRIADRYPEAVTALNTRFRNAAADDVALRTALLAAMVGAADPSFLHAFLDAVESDDPAILREAIQGLRALGDTSKLARLRALTEQADARVRLEATSTVGLLGREEADLERLLPRLSPATEANEAVRETAWRRFLEFCGRRPLPDRIAAAQRLRHLPELETRYLDALANNLTVAGGAPEDLERVLTSLATALVRQLRYAEAVQRLQSVYESQRGRSAADSVETGLRLLDAKLRSGSDPRVAELIRELVSHDQGAAGPRIVSTITSYLDGIAAQGTPAKTTELLTELSTVDGEPFGPEWPAMMNRLRALGAAPDTETDASPGGGAQGPG